MERDLESEAVNSYIFHRWEKLDARNSSYEVALLHYKQQLQSHSANSLITKLLGAICVSG